MFELIIDAFSYQFIQRAFIVGILVAISSSFIGTFLVLKKFSMIGDGLAHVSFASVALAFLLGESPLLVSIPIVLLASLLILTLTEKAHLHGDAAIGLISASAVALGVIIIDLGTGFNVDIYNYLFGSILTTQSIDVWIALTLSIAVIITIIFFYNSLFSITYDEEFSKANQMNTKVANYLLACLTSATIVLGIRVVGTMLISSLIIFPTVSALQIARGFKQTIIYALFISVIAVILGLLSSIIIDTPPGAMIVMVNASIFILLYLIRIGKRG